MVNDSVREELESKVIPIPKVEKKDSSAERANIISQTDKQKVSTTQIEVKPTDQTLLEFSNQNVKFPEWRLRVKSIVQQKMKEVKSSSSAESWSNATEKKGQEYSNEIISRALKRIENSRLKNQQVTKEVSGESITSSSAQEVRKEKIKTFPISDDVERFKTQKLPDLNQVISRIEKKQALPEEPLVIESRVEDLQEEADFYASLSQRFVAALFDVIICAFFSFVILLPFVITSRGFLLFEWLVVFLITDLLIMFIYMTTGVAFFGKTLGMRMLSLEVITFDEESEEAMCPTLHQAIANTVFYIFSLLTFGLGFLPAFFDKQRRTFHDLVAGTFIVKS